MILQPLVENAYVHGLVNKEGKIKIIINREQDILIIKVMNSCDEISKEDIEKINDKITNENVVETSNKNHGIALKNIKKRLDMFYSYAKLTIQNDGEYTSSIIEFKLKEEPTC
jgi:two-component system sensor histidine kinase YesM